MLATLLHVAFAGGDGGGVVLGDGGGGDARPGDEVTVVDGVEPGLFCGAASSGVEEVDSVLEASDVEKKIGLSRGG